MFVWETKARSRALLFLGPRAAGGSEALRTPFDYSIILGSEAFFYYLSTRKITLTNKFDLVRQSFIRRTFNPFLFSDLAAVSASYRLLPQSPVLKRRFKMWIFVSVGIKKQCGMLELMGLFRFFTTRPCRAEAWSPFMKRSSVSTWRGCDSGCWVILMWSACTQRGTHRVLSSW